MTSQVSKILMILAASLLGLLLSEALLAAGEPVEIRLHEATRTSASVVRLGDLADIIAAQPAVAAKWRAMPLFPAPAMGRTQAITSREIQDVVALHYGVDSKVRWTGAVEIRLTSAAEGSPEVFAPQLAPNQIALVSQPAIKGSTLTIDANVHTAKLAEACATFLQNQSGKTGWQVRPRVTSKELAALATAADAWRVTSVDAMNPGPRRFGISLGNGTALNISAEVTQSTMAVVANRALLRGTMLTADSLSLEPVSARLGEGNFAARLEEVVGQELQIPLAAGQPIDLRQVRRPLLVKRGGPVLVIAWAAGVKVKTNGRVMSDGAQGDLVEVQSTDGKERYMARVVEARTVEVFAGVLSVPADGVREEPKAFSRRPVQPLSGANNLRENFATPPASQPAASARD